MAEYPVSVSYPSSVTYPGGFNPASLGNLAAWYRSYDDVFRGVKDGSNAVSQWDDLSGNGRHATQATGSAQPLYSANGISSGKASVLFDGSSDFMEAAFTLVQPVTVYLLVKQVTYTANDYMVDGVNNDSMILRQSTTTGEISLFGGGNLAGPVLSIGSWGIITGVFNGAGSALQTNNTSEVTGNGGTLAPGGIRLADRGIFGGQNANIHLGEVLVYAAAHDSGTRASVKAYLATAGGITI